MNIMNNPVAAGKKKVVDAATNGQSGPPKKKLDKEEEVVNSEQDTTPDLRPAKRARGEGEGNLNDDGEEEASSDVEGEGGPADNWGDDGQNECDFGDEDNGDVNSEGGKHSGDDWGGSEYNHYEPKDDNDEAELESRVDIVGGVTANVEKESTEMTAAKLMEPDSSVEAIVARDDLNLLVEAPSKISKEATNQVETLSAEITSLKARLAVELEEMTTKIDAMNATLAEVTGNKALLNELTAKLEEATRNEEAMNNRLQTVTDDFAAKHASLTSALQKEQNVAQLAELTESVDMTRRQIDMERKMETLEEELKELKKALDMKEDKDLDASNSPKRRSRQSPRVSQKNSLEALAGQSRKSNFGRNKNSDEEDTHTAEHHDDEKLKQMIMDEIVDNGEEVKFNDIAGLEDTKDAIKTMVIYPQKRPDLFTGLQACPKGLLLFGPPGTGTLYFWTAQFISSTIISKFMLL